MRNARRLSGFYMRRLRSFTNETVQRAIYIDGDDDVVMRACTDVDAARTRVNVVRLLYLFWRDLRRSFAWGHLEVARENKGQQEAKKHGRPEGAIRQRQRAYKLGILRQPPRRLPPRENDWQPIRDEDDGKGDPDIERDEIIRRERQGVGEGLRRQLGVHDEEVRREQRGRGAAREEQDPGRGEREGDGAGEEEAQDGGRRGKGAARGDGGGLFGDGVRDKGVEEGAGDEDDVAARDGVAGHG